MYLVFPTNLEVTISTYLSNQNNRCDFMMTWEVSDLYFIVPTRKQ